MKNIDKKIVKLIISIIIIVLILPCLMVRAEEEDFIKDNQGINILEDTEVKNTLEDLYKYINSMKTDVELLQELDPIEYIKSYVETGKGTFTMNDFLKACSSYMFREIKTVLSLVLTIVIIAIICSLLKNLQNAFAKEGISQIAFFTCYALLIVILTRSFMISVDLVKGIIIGVSDFIGAILPVLVIMLAATGGLTQAATLDPFIIASTIIIPRIYLNLIIPLVLGSFVLEFANNMSTAHKITNLCKLVRQSILWMQGIILAVFIGLLTIRGNAAATLDAVTLKTAKFAVDNFIPIVGKAFSDAIASLAGYSLVLKNAVSSIGLLIIILLMLYPIIKLIMMAFTYKLAASLIEPISDSRITKCVASVADSIFLLMSCVLTVSMMFFILLSIMASSGRYVIGV